MKANTNNELQNFSIYENGDLVQEPLTIQAVRVAGNLAVRGLQATYRPLGRVLGEMSTSLALDIHDARYGTHLRSEHYARKRELATAALRNEVGL